MQNNSWLLPEGISEVLPDEARHLENLRTEILRIFATWGYQLVIPPLIDYLDSLLTGSGHDLELQTFKLVDQLSGEMLGIRADMTPQVARIDAHNLKNEFPTRLCYVGTVLHTVGNALEKTRSPMQIGAELYGHKGVESDFEVISLMLEMLRVIGIQKIHLDLGHVGIYRELSRLANLSSAQEIALFDVLQRKAQSELEILLSSFSISDTMKALLIRLPKLHGGRTILGQVRDLFGGASPEIELAINELTVAADQLSANFPDLEISFDLGELRGYHYHTGIVFAAFIPEVGREIARGGRYDNIGAVFGRARPATGFSADLRLLSALSRNNQTSGKISRIFAPAEKDSSLEQKIKELRSQGRVVIRELPGQVAGENYLGCKEVLEKNNDNWVITTIA